MDEEKRWKADLYGRLNRSAKRGQIVFAGSSLMEMFPVNELQQNLGITKVIYNRGICGMTTAELLEVIDVCILELAPSKLFINIGTNDMNGADFDKKQLFDNYERILDIAREKMPDLEIYVMAYYPVNAHAANNPWALETVKHRTNEQLTKVNEQLLQMAKRHGAFYINVNEGITDENGNMRAEYCADGIHMYPDGYYEVLKKLEKYL